MNLHPANQIYIARIFGELINKGLRLIISTHSDYIIRELNNLVMLSNTSKEYQDEISNMGYRTTMMIKPNMLGAYMFNYDNDRVVVDKIDVTKEGFASISIDDIPVAVKFLVDKLATAKKKRATSQSTHSWDNYKLSKEVISMAPAERKEIYGNYKSELTDILEEKYK